MTKKEEDLEIPKLGKGARLDIASKHYLQIINKEKTKKDKEKRLRYILEAHTRIWPQLIDTAVWLALLIIVTLIYFSGQALHTTVHTTDAIWVETCDGKETGYIEFYDEGGNPNGGEIEWKWRNQTKNAMARENSP